MDESDATVIHKKSTAVLQTPDKQLISLMSECFSGLYFNMTSTYWTSRWESPLSSTLIWKKQCWIEQSKKSLKVVTGPRFSQLLFEGNVATSVSRLPSGGNPHRCRNLYRIAEKVFTSQIGDQSRSRALRSGLRRAFMS